MKNMGVDIWVEPTVVLGGWGDVISLKKLAKTLYEQGYPVYVILYPEERPWQREFGEFSTSYIKSNEASERRECIKNNKRSEKAILIVTHGLYDYAEIYESAYGKGKVLIISSEEFGNIKKTNEKIGKRYLKESVLSIIQTFWHYPELNSEERSLIVGPYRPYERIHIPQDFSLPFKEYICQYIGFIEECPLVLPEKILKLGKNFVTIGNNFYFYNYLSTSETERSIEEKWGRFKSKYKSGKKWLHVERTERGKFLAYMEKAILRITTGTQTPVELMSMKKPFLILFKNADQYVIPHLKENNVHNDFGLPIDILSRFNRDGLRLSQKPYLEKEKKEFEEIFERALFDEELRKELSNLYKIITGLPSSIQDGSEVVAAIAKEFGESKKPADIIAKECWKYYEEEGRASF